MGLNEVALGISVPLFWVKVRCRRLGCGSRCCFWARSYVDMVLTKGGSDEAAAKHAASRACNRLVDTNFLVPFFGQVMAQQIGAGRADAILQTATFVGAAEAKQLGMVDAVVPKEDLMAVATKVLRKYLSMSRQVVN